MTFDPVSPLLSALSLHKPQAFALAFGAGAVSSIGPCALPRCIAAAGMTAPTFRALASKFVVLQAGLVAGYCIVGLGSAVLAAIVRHSMAFYVVLAGLLCVAGISMLLRDRVQCGHSAERAGARSGTFLMGASFAFVVSPCCTPVVLAVGTLSATPLYAAVLMAAFAAGHGVPMLAAMLGSQAVRQRLRSGIVERIAASFSGTLLLALGAYYAVLA